MIEKSQRGGRVVFFSKGQRFPQRTEAIMIGAQVVLGLGDLLPQASPRVCV